jgi:hypothetical protein
LGDSAAGLRGEGEEVGEVFCGAFFDEGEDGGDLVDVGLGLFSMREKYGGKGEMGECVRLCLGLRGEVR